MSDLLELAKDAREGAYAPYSKFKVGAAIETESGKIYTGSNVENASYGLSICAERVAATKAVSDGENKFKKVAIVADTKVPCPPCGACRQFLVEFGDNIEILTANMKGETKTYTIDELLKDAFHFGM